MSYREFFCLNCILVLPYSGPTFYLSEFAVVWVKEKLGECGFTEYEKHFVMRKQFAGA